MTEMLTGKRILITRAHAQAAELQHKLAERGATPVLFPTVEIALLNTPALEEAVRVISQFVWIAFSGAPAVESFWARLAAVDVDERVLQHQRFIALGKAAARALTKHGPLAEFVVEENTVVESVNRMGEVRGQWVLMLQAEEFREPFAAELAARGAVVREVAAYRTRPSIPDASGLAELERGVDAITFAEPVAAINFVALAGPEAVRSATIACSGPVTAQAARAAGLPVHIIAATPTVEGLIEALVESLGSRTSYRDTSNLEGL
jgi:uroporphyrinogen III methyltransferase/synthase